MYTLKTLRRKAEEIGYAIHKGLQRNTVAGWIYPHRTVGYMVEDMTTGYYEWGSYDSDYTHLWTLEDVEDFLKSEYERLGLKF